MFLIAFFPFLLSFIVAISSKSIIKGFDSEFYDISDLDQTFTIETDQYLLSINPCRNIEKTNSFVTLKSESDDSLQTAVIVGHPLKYFPSPEKEGGFIALYGGGSDYDGNGFPFITMVSYVCDRSVSTHSGPSIVANDNSKYFVIWRTPSACPIENSGTFYTFGNVFISIIILLFLFFLYIIIGSCYNYLTNDSRLVTTKIIPHFHSIRRLFSDYEEI